MDIVTVNDDEDEEVQVVYSNIQYLSKLREIDQQIELLRPFINSHNIFPLQYDEFHKYAKSMSEKYKDKVIFMAWKKGATAQITDMVLKKNTLPLVKHTQTCSPVIDLTEPTTSPVTSQSPLVESRPLTTSRLEKDQLLQSQPAFHDAVLPVALVKNLNLQQRGPSLQSTLDQDVSTVNKVFHDRQEYMVPNVTHRCKEKNRQRKKNKSIQTLISASEFLFVEVSKEKANDGILKLEPFDLNPTEINENKVSELSDTTTQYVQNSTCEPFHVKCCNNIDSNNTYETNPKSKNNVRKRKYHLKQNNVLKDLTKSENHEINFNFTGDQTKFKKAKCNSKVISKNNGTKHRTEQITMSEAELKRFLKKQKREGIRETRKLQMKEAEKITDRLVDVFIPKYYNISN